MITMNEKDKNEMLDFILNEKEEYLYANFGEFNIPKLMYNWRTLR